ncbi:MAG: alkaline phosphatase family protein [Thermoprotei archaeon]|nr:alkaline phosphatase family protein [Thermoprotei archaeon]
MIRRTVIIGLDSFSYRWLKPLFSRGHLLNLKKLIDEGSFALLRAPIVGATPHNWATISTGTMFTHHGCSWWVRAPGSMEPLYGFSSTTLMAEPIWAAASRAGVRSILMDVPQSYPVRWENVIHIGEDGRPDTSSRCIQLPKGYLSEDLYEQRMKRIQSMSSPLLNQYKGLMKVHLVKINVREATEWEGMECDELLEAEIPIRRKEWGYVPDVIEERESADKYYLLIRPAERLVELYSEKRASAKLGESKLGSWSNWILWEFKVGDSMVKAYFRFKLIRMSEDGRSVHVYFTQIYPATGFTLPEELSEELIRTCGPYIHSAVRQQVGLCGACDVYTFVEELGYVSSWYAKAMDYLLKNKDWGLFYIKLHAPDFLNHLCAYMIDERHPLFSPDRAEEGWKLWGKVLDPIDDMVRSALDVVGDNGVIVVVSDHGSKLRHPYHMYSAILARRLMIEALKKEGFIVENRRGQVDWVKSLIRPGTFGFNISLRGRDPAGVVEPEEYEKVRLKLIEVLRDLKNPVTGGHLFKLVCRREDAEVLGYGGCRCADVFLWPNYGDDLEFTYDKIFLEEFAEVGVQDIGTWEWPTGIPAGAHDELAMLIIRGPGVKEGYTCSKTYTLAHVTPTVCHISGIPLPRDCTGGIIREILKET